MSSWIERYQAGEHEAVWREMVTQGAAITTDAATLADAEAVAAETMRRVQRNIETLARRLDAAGFELLDHQRPIPGQVLTDPPADLDERIAELEAGIHGRVPISIKAFWHQVGGVDLNGHLPGWEIEYPDGLQVLGFDDYLVQRTVEPLEDSWWEEDYLPLELAADYLHKNDVSGGAAYGIRLPNPAADAKWEEDDLHPNHTFVEYLRTAIGDAGLPGWRRPRWGGGSQDRPPGLTYLIQGLEPF